VPSVIEACRGGHCPVVAEWIKSAPHLLRGGSIFVNRDECVDVARIGDHDAIVGTTCKRIYGPLSTAAKYN
jgi:hypothetical protein